VSGFVGQPILAAAGFKPALGREYPAFRQAANRAARVSERFVAQASCLCSGSVSLSRLPQGRKTQARMPVLRAVAAAP